MLGRKVRQSVQAGMKPHAAPATPRSTGSMLSQGFRDPTCPSSPCLGGRDAFCDVEVETREANFLVQARKPQPEVEIPGKSRNLRKSWVAQCLHGLLQICGGRRRSHQGDATIHFGGIQRKVGQPHHGIVRPVLASCRLVKGYWHPNSYGQQA